MFISLYNSFTFSHTARKRGREEELFTMEASISGKYFVIASQYHPRKAGSSPRVLNQGCTSESPVTVFTHMPRTLLFNILNQ